MYSQWGVWSVQAVVVGACGVEGYSSVMRWMVVEVVCAGRGVTFGQLYQLPQPSQTDTDEKHMGAH